MSAQLYGGLSASDVPFLLAGIWRTCLLALLSGVVGTITGAVLGCIRARSAAGRFLFAPLVDIVRSVPLIIQFILLNSILAMAGHPQDPFWLGVTMLGVYAGVGCSEYVRAGLNAVPIEARKTGRSMGLNYWQELLFVSTPIAWRTALPGILGVAIALIKDTALVSVSVGGYIDFLRAAQILIGRTNEGLKILGGVGIVYFLLCYPISIYGKRLERRFHVDQN